MRGTRRTWPGPTALAVAIAWQAAAAPAVPPGADATGRQALRRRAAVAMIVETFDRELFLDTARRQAVAAALEAAWQPAWEAVLVPPRRIQFQPVQPPPHQPQSAAPRQPLPRGIEECVLQALGPELAAAWVASQPAAPHGVLVVPRRLAQ